MWVNAQMFALYFLAIMVCMEELFASKNNSLLKDCSALRSERKRVRRMPPRRSYCSLQGCCLGRDDNCIVQYYARNATCYCDDFCASDPPDSVDCCPDFWIVCHKHSSSPVIPEHVRPLQEWGCFKDGRQYGEGAMFKDNCNSCKCINSDWKCTDETCLIRPSLIERINNGNYGWKADNFSQFWSMSLKEGFNYRLGTFQPSAALMDMRPVTESTVTAADFPEHFVASYEWPGWIHDPLDQGNCAASWAFSTASVAADRVAIHSHGLFTDNLSPQNLISCDTKNQHGCKGGSINGAWSYIKKYGLVSHACYPLFWNHLHPMTCAISSVFDAEGKSQATQPCPNHFEQSNRIYQCGSPYRVSSKEADIMREIKENGPVQAIMKVYNDFFLYKSGIYRHTTQEPQHDHQKRLHSVKLVGWGSLEDADGQLQKFWIAANSWGSSWGENGYFRILRGQNESAVEKLIIATKCNF